MDDLVAFLRARLDEDEAAAKAVTFRSQFLAEGHSVVSRSWPGNPPMPIADVIDAETAAHIARYDPARMLREVASARADLAEYEQQLSYEQPGEGGDARETEDRDWDRAILLTLEDVIKRRAAVYSGHPGYRPEWAPTQS